MPTIFCVFFIQKFQKATSGYNKVLGDSLRLNPHLLFRDYNEATENVLYKDAVYVRVSLKILQTGNIPTN